jgi:hypothetical protein
MNKSFQRGLTLFAAAASLGALLALTLFAGNQFANAGRVDQIVRNGASYDGAAGAATNSNPDGCKVFVHKDRDQTELHVSCIHSDTAARIRYRYLKDRGVIHGPAEFSAVVEKHGGQGQVSDVRWMDPTPRTGRVVVPAGLYVHIIKVKWVAA